MNPYALIGKGVVCKLRCVIIIVYIVVMTTMATMVLFVKSAIKKVQAFDREDP